MVGFLILLAILAIVGFWGVAIYNGLVTARNAFRNAFAQIDVQLQRRFDLIPNLVEIAKTYMSHERETLEAVVAARSAAQSGLAAAKANPGDAEMLDQPIVALAVKESGDGQVVLIGSGIAGAAAEGIAFTAVILHVHIR